ncbi:hypothetical protein OROMI_002714 [Orobanche minor]
MSTIIHAAHRGSIINSRPLSPVVSPCLQGVFHKDHVGPAVLHEMEKFLVHSLALLSLLSDRGAKTPEEALLHVFGEARRTTPSVLYLPQFHMWWESAHDQLRVVLPTLLEDLPSDLPILLLGTSSTPLAEICDNPSLIFSERNVLHLSPASAEDRSLFFDHLIAAALSVKCKGIVKDSARSQNLYELPKTPKVASEPKASELRAKAETQRPTATAHVPP